MTAHPAQAELAACVALLKWVDQTGRAARAGNQAKGVALTQYELAIALPEISDIARDAALDPTLTSTDLQPSGWIYGPRAFGPDTPLVPAITLRWNTTGVDPSLQIFVVLAVAGTTNNSPQGLQTTAYRYEMRVTGTVHDFDHAQPSLSLVQGGTTLPGARAPLNTTSPAFPLDSAGYAGLTMCMIRSLYGTKKFGNMLSQNPALRRAVQPYLGQMPAFFARNTTTVLPVNG